MLNMISKPKKINFVKISKTPKIRPERREMTTSDIKIIKFSMLTHVCGVVRGPSLHMVRSTLCDDMPWYGLRPDLPLGRA